MTLDGDPSFVVISKGDSEKTVVMQRTTELVKVVLCISRCRRGPFRRVVF